MKTQGKGQDWLSKRLRKKQERERGKGPGGRMSPLIRKQDESPPETKGKVVRMDTEWETEQPWDK